MLGWSPRSTLSSWKVLFCQLIDFPSVHRIQCFNPQQAILNCWLLIRRLDGALIQTWSLFSVSCPLITLPLWSRRYASAPSKPGRTAGLWRDISMTLIFPPLLPVCCWFVPLSPCTRSCITKISNSYRSMYLCVTLCCDLGFGLSGMMQIAPIWGGLQVSWQVAEATDWFITAKCYVQHQQASVACHVIVAAAMSSASIGSHSSQAAHLCTLKS